MARSVEELTAPISDDDPCGADVEYDTEFQAMESAFQEKPEQEYGDTVIAGEPPDYKEVRDNAFTLLDRSRDLRPMAYAAVATLHTDGLPQFRDILKAIAVCMDQYWDEVHPRLDPDDDNDPIMRMNALQMLNERSCVARGVEQAILVELRGVGQFSLRSIDLAEGKEQPREDEEVPETLAIKDAFAQADDEVIEELRTAVSESVEQFEEIRRVWDEKVGTTAASLDFSLAVQTLAHLRTKLAEYAGGDEEAAGEEAAGEEGAEGGGGGARAQTISGAVNSREDVNRVFDKVIEYYERNEPSSPVPLLVERAKRLVTANFTDIIKDIVPDAISQADLVTGRQSDEDEY
jgi:type VI secretion system protein ImpA